MAAVNHLLCPLCKKDVSWPGFGGHMLSRAHIKKYVKPALLKENKDAIATWKKSDKSRGLPYITVKDTMIYMCFGCKKVGQNHHNTLCDHLSKCEKADKHIAILKELLEVKDEPVEARGESFITVEVDQHKKDSEMWKKEAERLKKKYDESEDDLSVAHAEVNVLENLLKRFLGIGYEDFRDKYRDAIHEGTLKTYEELMERDLNC